MQTIGDEWIVDLEQLAFLKKQATNDKFIDKFIECKQVRRVSR